MHWKSRRAALGLACLLAVPACKQLRGDPALERPGTLVLVASSDDVSEEVLNGTAWPLLYLPLLREDKHGEMTGGLARSWRQSPDGLDWIFQLRSDVRWHDGAPVTAHDLAFAFDLLGDPAVAVMATEQFAWVRVLDDTTVTLRTTQPWAALKWRWQTALPEHLLRGLDRNAFRSWKHWQAPIGNGPFRFSRSLPATMIEFEANPDYPGGRPAIDRVRIRFVGKAALTEFLAGKVDVLPSVSAAEALKIAQDPRFQLYHWFSAELANVIHWRHDHPFFADPRVRRALTLGIDRRELMAVLHLPDSTPVPDALFTKRQFRRGELPAPLPFDPPEAKRLLRAAGWSDTDGDGVLDRDGQPFRFTLVVPQMWYGVGETAVFLKDQLRRIGVVAELHQLPSLVATQRLRDGEFEAYLGFVSMQPDAVTGYTGGVGAPGPGNPRLRELGEGAARTADADLRDALYREMTELYRADLPATPLFPFVTMSAAHRRVKGLSSPFRTDAAELAAELRLDGSDHPRR